MLVETDQEAREEISRRPAREGSWAEGTRVRACSAEEKEGNVGYLDRESKDLLPWHCRDPPHRRPLGGVIRDPQLHRRCYWWCRSLSSCR